MFTFSRSQSTLLRLLIVLGITAGLANQTWTISNDYFKYPTSTLVTLQNHLDVTIGPQVGFHVVNELPIGKEVRELFKTINSSILTGGYVRTPTWAKWNDTTALRTKLFHQMEDYYISVAPSKEIPYSPDIMYLNRESIYAIQLMTQFFDRQLDVFVHPFHSDFEGLHKTDSKVDFDKFKQETCEVSLTYSTKISKLAPAPYDTDCRNYPDKGYTSKENCISECLSEFTTKNGFVIVSNVLDKEKYQNSSLLLFTWYLRTMKTRAGRPVDIEFLQEDYENEKKHRNHPNHPVTLMVEKILQIFDPYKDHWKKCMALCRRPDCITEVHLSVIQSVSASGNYSKHPKKVYFYLFPPNDQVTSVISQPKITLMDFIVYILSLVSFWFGFCPLQIADKVKKFTSSRTRFPSKFDEEEIEKIFVDLRRRVLKVKERKKSYQYSCNRKNKCRTSASVGTTFHSNQSAFLT